MDFGANRGSAVYRDMTRQRSIGAFPCFFELRVTELADEERRGTGPLVEARDLRASDSVPWKTRDT